MRVTSNQLDTRRALRPCFCPSFSANRELKVYTWPQLGRNVQFPLSPQSPARQSWEAWTPPWSSLHLVSRSGFSGVVPAMRGMLRAANLLVLLTAFSLAQRLLGRGWAGNADWAALTWPGQARVQAVMGALSGALGTTILSCWTEGLWSPSIHSGGSFGSSRSSKNGRCGQGPLQLLPELPLVGSLV